MSDITYMRGTKRVRQTLGTLSYYDLEGDFDSVISKLQSEHKSYKRFLEESIEFVECGGFGKYLDGVEKKPVKFDKLTLDWVDTYDNEKELRVIGERDFDAAELAALEKETKDQQEKEKEYLRKLKKKYPDV